MGGVPVQAESGGKQAGNRNQLEIGTVEHAEDEPGMDLSGKCS